MNAIQVLIIAAGLAAGMTEITQLSTKQVDIQTSENLSLTEDMTTALPTLQNNATVPSENTDATEASPQDTFAVRDEKGKICILAKFTATFSIKFKNNGGEQAMNIEMPEKVNKRGICGKVKQEPALEISWRNFRFKFIFTRGFKCQQEVGKDCWGVNSMLLTYDPSSMNVPSESKGILRTIRSQEKKMYFAAPMNKSYVCPSPEVVSLHNAANAEKGTVRFSNMQIQPSSVQNGQFSIGSRCDQVSYGYGPEPDVDKTVPIAAGSTLAVLTLLTVIGYAIKRSIKTKRVEYSNME